MIKNFLYPVCLILILSCTSTKAISHEKAKDFNAVVGKTGDCGNSRLLTIYKEDRTSFILPVYEINLPDSLRIEGLTLSIEWREPIGDEMKRCLTLGRGYGQIYITSAEKVDQDSTTRNNR